MAEHDADVIVVGSGSLGSLAALQIARAGHDVLILEAGPVVPDWKITENWRTSPRKGNLNDPFGDIPYAPNSWSPGYVDDDIDVSMIPGTLTVAGGTSRHWTGVAWRLLPEEMRMRSLFGVSRDWPFDYDELEPWYTEAEYQVGVIGADETDYSGQDRGVPYPPRSRPYPLPPEAKPYALQRFQMRTSERGYRLLHAPNVRLSRPYDGRPACVGNNICNPNCPIGAKHSGLHDLRAAQDAGARLVTGALVDRLEVDGRGRVTAVSYLDPGGERTALTAKIVVLAAHGFETPKLLLMNDLANSSGMVGRNLMIHPTLTFGFYADEDLWVGRGQYLHGANMQRRLQPDRSEMSGGFYQFMNHNPALTVAAPFFDTGEGGSGGSDVAYTSRGNGGRSRRRLVGPALDAEMRHRAARYLSSQTLLEDLPDPANFVAPDPDTRTPLGLPGLKMRYRLQDYCRDALPRTLDDFANWVQAMGATPQERPGDTWSNQHHIMGTTIMGDDPSDSVVDADLRCHDHENLFLVTTGVFPSSSCVNPTLTGMALAMRAGAHVAAEV